MATKTRVEWGNINRPDSAAPNLMTAVPTAAQTLTVDATATVAGSRPTVPAGVKFAFITAVDGNVIVKTGTDPTADQTSGKLCVQGVETPISVQPGHKLSFIELA